MIAEDHQDQFELGHALVEQIIDHARDCFPEEACGIIAGTGDKGLAVYRGQNVSPTPHVAFDLDSATLARQLDFEQAGLAMTAVYHSHPMGPATPSAVDIDQASEGYPDSVSIICSLADESTPVLRAFRIDHGLARGIVLI